MSTPSQNMVHVDTHDAIRVVQIDNPPVNALGATGWRELVDVFQSAAADTSVRAVVFHGGEGRFCAGADISALIHPDPDADDAEMLLAVAQAAEAIRSCRVPVVAAIDGPAHGGGLEVALGCDLRLASLRATFAASGVNMGLIASVGSLAETIGDTQARRMLLTGARIDAETASSWGVVTELSEAPLAAAVSLAELIASKPPLAVEAAKAALNSARTQSRAEQSESTTNTFRALVSSDDHHEAITAFLEKRPGTFARR